MTNLRRSASLDRLLAETSFRHKLAVERSRYSTRGYPYNCTADYYAYRYWPYYLDRRVGDLPVPWYYWPYRFSSRYPFELYPEYYSEYLRGYNYGLWKYEPRYAWSPRYKSGV